ncbi:MAG: ABC transporter ATP-binding protein [Methanobacteriota archaeon]|nr:MAG: ABC transporter ATP-binding protein [Euryarchaeota archaeon]
MVRMVELTLKNVNIFYDDFHAVKDVNLTVNDSEIVTLLGPSGCGKTTLLRSIAGFIIPKSGKILVNGEDITEVPPRKREMGMIFQNYALWPHMTIEENVGFGLKIRGVPTEEIRKKVAQLLKQVQLEGQEKKYPTQLSGGQQQRVALIRALAIEPVVLLCDEPLSNLDYKLRVELRTEIRDVAKRVGVTVVYVTHDQTEALAISDRIAVINKGQIEQVGTPLEIFHDPENLFVATFIGESNVLQGTVEEQSDEGVKIRLDAGGIVTVPITAVSKGEKVTVMTRYDGFSLGEGTNTFSGIVKHKSFMGTYMQFEIELQPNVTIFYNEPDAIAVKDINEGDNISVSMPSDQILVFDSEGKRIR